MNQQISPNKSKSLIYVCNPKHRARGLFFYFLLKQDSEERKKIFEASSGESSSDQTSTTNQSSSGLNEKAAISRAFDTLARAASSTSVRIFS